MCHASSSKAMRRSKSLTAASVWQQELDDQEHDVKGSFYFEPQSRLAGTDGFCRTEEEKGNPRLMELIHQVGHSHFQQPGMSCGLARMCMQCFGNMLQVQRA